MPWRTYRSRLGRIRTQVTVSEGAGTERDATVYERILFDRIGEFVRTGSWPDDVDTLRLPFPEGYPIQPVIPHSPAESVTNEQRLIDDEINLPLVEDWSRSRWTVGFATCDGGELIIPCQIDIDARWNGWRIVRMTKETAWMLARHLVSTTTSLSVMFTGEQIQFIDPESDDSPQVYEPDDEGFYWIGAYMWRWEDAAPWVESAHGEVILEQSSPIPHEASVGSESSLPWSPNVPNHGECGVRGCCGIPGCCDDNGWDPAHGRHRLLGSSSPPEGTG